MAYKVTANGTTHTLAELKDLEGLSVSGGSSGSSGSTESGASAAEVAALKASIKLNSDDISTLKSSDSTQSADIATLKTTSSSTASDVSTLKTTVSGNSSDIAVLKSQVQTHTADIAALKSSAGSSSGGESSDHTCEVSAEDFRSLKTQCDADDARITALETNQKTDAADIAQAKTDISGLDTRLTTAESSISSNADAIESERTTRTSQYSTINADLQDAITTTTKHSTRLTTLETKATEQASTLETQASTLESLGATVTEQTATLESQAKAISDLQNSTGGSSTETISADVEWIKNLTGYQDSDVYGLQVDFENMTCTRLAGAVGKTAGSDFDVCRAMGGRKRVQCDYNGIAKYWSCDTDHDGYEPGYTATPFEMVYQPAFYYSFVPLKTATIQADDSLDSAAGRRVLKANFYISDNKKPGFELFPCFYDPDGNAVDFILIGAYQGSVLDSTQSNLGTGYVHPKTISAGQQNYFLGSISGYNTASQSSPDPSLVEALAQQAGLYYHAMTSKAYMANAWLMMIEAGQMEVQSVYGRGNVDGGTLYKTGGTSTLGDKSGAGTGDGGDGYVSISYRGMENPYGNVPVFLPDVNIELNPGVYNTIYTYAGGRINIADSFTYTQSTSSSGIGYDGYTPLESTLTTESGYWSDMLYLPSAPWLILPGSKNGSSAAPVGDFATARASTANITSTRYLICGGTSSSGDQAGVFCADCYTAGESSTAFSAATRVMLVPNVNWRYYTVFLKTWQDMYENYPS